MNYIPLKILCFTILMSVTLVRGQEEDFVRGVLIDSNTSEPVVFATIRLKDRALGVISNFDGSFKIPIKFRELGDVLEISSMGYQNFEILVNDLKTTEPTIIRLIPAIFELDEAVVKGRRKRGTLKPETIVQRAIDAIPENYPINPYSQVGYYRDYQLNKGQYVNLNEAILEMFDQGFRSIDSSTTRIILYDYRENKDFIRDSIARQPYNYSFEGGAKVIDEGYLDSYGGNEFTILSVHNAIRNYSIDTFSFVHRLKDDLLKEHNFSREEDSYIGDKALFTIRFVKRLSNHVAHGRLFISKDDYSIYKMEYAVYNLTKQNAIVSSEKDGAQKKLVFEVIITYRKKEEKMFLNYISFHNNFSVWQPPQLRLKFVEVNSQKKCIILTFNEILNQFSARDLNNYRCRFYGKKIRLENVLVLNDQVLLYPSLKTEKERRRFEEILLLGKTGGLDNKVLDFRIKDVKDLQGNLINEWTIKNFNQFREFFVQDVKNFTEVVSDSLFMDKKRPIFDNQPIMKPKNFDDYWMNTPLKNIQ